MQALKVALIKRLPVARSISRTGAVAVGLITTAAVTLVTSLLPRTSTAAAALSYALGVMVATATSGMGAGLPAAIVSFFALNFFFTAPFYTLRVNKSEDIVALAVFLFVAIVIGLFFSAVMSQRTEAERREREIRLLQQLATRLLSGEPIEQELRRFAASMVDLLELGSCEITSELTPAPILAVREHFQGDSGDRIVAPMAWKGREVGRIEIAPSPSRPHLSQGDREAIELLADQVSLALQGVEMGGRAQAAQVEAERNKLRAALFSSVTHDLRTPLTSISASATSLLDDDSHFDTEGSSILLQTIQSEAARLNRLVGNLMHLSQVQAGALVPNKVPVGVDEIIERVLARLKPQLRDHGVRITSRDDVPDVAADVVQIDQLLTNLFENAVKFSPPGSEISISAARWRHMVKVSVQDHGSGIPLEQRERVFEPFVRAPAHENQGSGLGLAISRAIVVAHGGRIWAEETPGGGTTVAFELPAADR